MSDDPIDRMLAMGERMEALLRRMEARDISLRADFLEELGKTRTEIMERFDWLQARVDLVRDDVAVAMGSSEAVSRANDTTKADIRTLTEQFGIMWKQLKQLQTEVRELRENGG